VTGSVEVMVTVGDRLGADAIRAVLTSSEDTLIAERRSIDGSVAEWVIFGVATLQSLTGLAAVVAQLVRSNQVAVVKVGDIEVHHPRRRDVDELMSLVRVQLAGADQDRGRRDDG
jgi:hypothetical protein